MDSLKYLPLYRIKGDTMQCDQCKLKLDFRFGHYYCFYILDGDDMVGLIFEHSFRTANQTGLSLGFGKREVALLVKFMTIDPIEVLQNDHEELTITADKSLTRKVINWWRKKRGLYTEKSELNEATHRTRELLYEGRQGAVYMELKNNLDMDKGDGVYCTSCMKARHPSQHRNAVQQLKGYAEFITSESITQPVTPAED